MELEMELNRLKITGDINHNTPQIVIFEICDSLGIKFDRNNYLLQYNNQLIRKIYKYCPKNIIKIVNNESLRILARYINCHYKKWDKKSLLEAYRFLHSFENNVDEYLKEKEKRFTFIYGLQTSDSIESLNACVLYRLCKYFSINTDFSNTTENMAYNLKLYFHLSEPSLNNQVKHLIFEKLKYSASENELVNTLNLYHKTIELPTINIDIQNRESYSYEDYERTADIISRTEKKIPETHLEAIVMGALYYKIDLTDCEDPIVEYNFLIKNPYFPYDKNLTERLSKHSDSLDNPYLNKIFNPNLPQNMYTNNDLISLCGEEGISVIDDSYYPALQIAYLSETFIHGKQRTDNKETTFLEQIKDLDYDQIVVYGVRSSNNLMRAYTYAELTDTFSSFKRFSDPITNEIYSEEAINKLLLLCQKEKRETESEDIYKERIDLGEEIERIKIYNNTKNETVKDFCNLYENLDEEGKRKCEDCLNKLLHCAMYMRNWDGKGDYPLTSESTNFGSEKQIVVDDRVTQSLIDFESALEEVQQYDNLGDYIHNLPLMQYHNESGTFVTSNDENEGLTIKDRIRIVRGGENESFSSCIRLSSNKFCATSYYYMVLIGFRMPFTISEVSSIF